jgi:hypothetical protein
VIRIPYRMTRDQFRSAFDRLKIGAVREGTVYADDAEVEWMQSLLTPLGPEMTVQWTDEGLEPVTCLGAVIAFTITERYFRAQAKMGFHFFLSCIPLFRGDEECFLETREYIVTEGSIGRCDRG